MGTWPLNASLFNGDDAAGPVPTLFSEEPEAALEALKENPHRAHADLQRLARLFFQPELISLDESGPLIKKPRYKILLIYFGLIQINTY
jgi:hypothetical protein